MRNPLPLRAGQLPVEPFDRVVHGDVGALAAECPAEHPREQFVIRIHRTSRTQEVFQPEPGAQEDRILPGDHRRVRPSTPNGSTRNRNSPATGGAALHLFSQVMTMPEKIHKSEEEWRRELTPEQYHILREKGTERPFTGEYAHTKTPGAYLCAACGQELFQSETKFESGSGWPSFYQPAAPERVETHEDGSLGMRRTEVVCARCG